MLLFDKMQSMICDWHEKQSSCWLFLNHPAHVYDNIQHLTTKFKFLQGLVFIDIANLANLQCTVEIILL